MANEVLVKADGVSKKFCRSLKRSLWYGVQDVSRELVGKKSGYEQLRTDEFWALKNVSFELRRGECLGLIGPNGAGKSTLLKVLNGLIKPDRGTVSIKGRVGALIELGAGFNPILSARENIYVNGSVLGFSKAEIEQKFDEIVDFAEVDDFLDMPVQNFSSGMKVRLGFAIAAQIKPDVLIIDEVLAVGDAGFRAKCYGKIADLSETTAVIFVSHQIQHVSRLADEVMVLDSGNTHFRGTTPEGINQYLSLFESPQEKRHGSGELLITRIALNGAEDELKLYYGQPIHIELDIEASCDLDSAVVDIAFVSLDGDVVAECSNFVENKPLRFVRDRTYTLSIDIAASLLNPGVYDLSCLLASADMVRHYDWHRRIKRIEVVGGRPGTAPVQFVADWNIRPREYQ